MWCRSEAREKINHRPVEKRTSVYAFQRQVFLVKNLLLFRTTDILAQEYTSVYILGLQVCGANLLLRSATDIRVGNDTSRSNFFAATAYRQINSPSAF